MTSPINYGMSQYDINIQDKNKKIAAAKAMIQGQVASSMKLESISRKYVSDPRVSYQSLQGLQRAIDVRDESFTNAHNAFAKAKETAEKLTQSLASINTNDVAANIMAIDDMPPKELAFECLAVVTRYFLDPQCPHTVPANIKALLTTPMLDNLKAEVAKLQKTATTRSTATTVEVDDLKADVKRLRGKEISMAATLKEKSDEILTASAEVASLKQSLQVEKTFRESTFQNACRYRSARDDLRKSTDDLKKQIERMTGSKNDLDRLLETVRQELEEKVKDWADAESRCRQTSNSYQNLHGIYDNLKVDYENLLRETSQLREDQDNLKARLAQVQKSHDHAQSLHDSALHAETERTWAAKASNEKLVAQHAAALKAKSDEFEETLKIKAKEYEDCLSKKSDELTEALNAKSVEYDELLSSQLDNQSLSLKLKDSAMDRLVSSHKCEMDALKKQNLETETQRSKDKRVHDRSVADLKFQLQELEASLAAAIASRDEEIRLKGEIVRKNDELVEQLEIRHQDTVSQRSERHGKMLLDKDADHKRAIQDLAQAHRVELANKDRSYNELDNTYQTLLGDFKSQEAKTHQLTIKLDDATSALTVCQERSSTLEQEKATLETSSLTNGKAHTQELAEKDRAHEAAIAAKDKLLNASKTEHSATVKLQAQQCQAMETSHAETVTKLELTIKQSNELVARLLFSFVARSRNSRQFWVDLSRLLHDAWILDIKPVNGAKLTLLIDARLPEFSQHTYATSRLDEFMMVVVLYYNLDQLALREGPEAFKLVVELTKRHGAMDNATIPNLLAVMFTRYVEMEKNPSPRSGMFAAAFYNLMQCLRLRFPGLRLNENSFLSLDAHIAHCDVVVDTIHKFFKSCTTEGIADEHSMLQSLSALGDIVMVNQQFAMIASPRSDYVATYHNCTFTITCKSLITCTLVDRGRHIDINGPRGYPDLHVEFDKDSTYWCDLNIDAKLCEEDRDILH